MQPIPALSEWFLREEDVAVCFSGGLDSTVLAAHSAEATGGGLALMADMPFLSDRQRRAAREVAGSLGIRLEIVRLTWEDLRDAPSNDGMRCYACKKAMYSALSRRAGELGYRRLASGDNADDAEDDRPGMRAGAEAGVLRPLRELGIGRKDVEACIRTMGLPVAIFKDTCLATRYPEGVRLTPEKIRFAEECEDLVRNLAGVGLVRVRIAGVSCTVLMSPEETEALLRHGDAVVSSLERMGFDRVLIDPNGYR